MTKLTPDRDETIAAMVKWFRENYEDPVHNTPVDGGEYVYIWGGPVDAEEELRDHFDTVPEDLIEDAALILTNRYDAHNWVPKPPPHDPARDEMARLTISKDALREAGQVKKMLVALLLDPDSLQMSASDRSFMLATCCMDFVVAAICAQARYDTKTAKAGFDALVADTRGEIDKACAAGRGKP